MSSVKSHEGFRSWTLIDKLDGLGLFLIGLLSFGYILFFMRLAEINIQLPFLNFPIFVGEIVMIILFFVAVAKCIVLARNGQLRFNRWHGLLALYFLWIFVKALRGYIGWGPLAFRNAALFYYVIFAVYTYFFFNLRFFSPAYLRAYFLLLIAGILGSRPFFRYVFSEYFFFTVFCLLFALIPRVRPRWVQLASLLLLPWFTFYNLFLLSRSHLLASTVACFLGCLYFGFLKIQRPVIRGGVIATAFVIILLLLFCYGDRPTLKSLVDFDGIKATLQSYDNDIAERGKTFQAKQFQVKLYNKAVFYKRVQAIFDETKQGIFLQLDKILAERMQNGSPIFKEFIIASKKSIYKTIDDYLESERDLYEQGKILQFWEIMEVADKAYQNYLKSHPELAEQEKGYLITAAQPASQDLNNVAVAAEVPSVEAHASGKSPEVPQDPMVRSSQPVTESLKVTEDPKPKITESPKVTEGPKVAEGQKMTKSQPVTERQKVAEGQEMMKRQPVTQGPKVAEGQKMTKSQPVAERQKVAEGQKMTKGQPVTESPKVTEGKRVILEQPQVSVLKQDQEGHADISAVIEDFNKKAIPELKGALESSMTGRRSVSSNNGTSIFRLLIWRDMIREIRQYKPIFGFSFGMPQRSRSLEILNIGVGEWSRDGYITPHCVSLHYLYRAGIVGVLIILFIIGLIGYLYLGFFRLRSKSGPFLVMCLVYWFLVSNFGVVIELPYSAVPFWSLFGLTLAYYHYCRRKVQEEGAV